MKRLCARYSVALAGMFLLIGVLLAQVNLGGENGGNTCDDPTYFKSDGGLLCGGDGVSHSGLNDAICGRDGGGLGMLCGKDGGGIEILCGRDGGGMETLSIRDGGLPVDAVCVKDVGAEG